MDTKTMEQVGDFLRNATPDQMMELAQRMANEKPELMGLMIGIPDKQERARKLVQLEFNQNEPNEDYIHGLVDGLWFGKLLTSDERDEFKSKLRVNE
ncbi:hypothetical protein [Psychrobacter phenylpyruvicus]|uniref:Uncharacterized protein n=1 Tax=Psychrobacter phenylpyruvicus TaxID=29432 RepID=A0A379LRW6_9GAMM|nr:hypothetical protein [Psychrobacter phenylpyruvicus]SUD98788.1 Uncharacterised protein [Psychrobacter phenylpyruvicus]